MNHLMTLLLREISSSMRFPMNGLEVGVLKVGLIVRGAGTVSDWSLVIDEINSLFERGSDRQGAAQVWFHDEWIQSNLRSIRRSAG